MSQRNLLVPKKKPRVQGDKLNGSTPILFQPAVIEDLDCRFGWARKLKRLAATLERQSKSTSTARKLLCRRAAFQSILVETLEVQALKGAKDFNHGRLILATNTLVGLLRLIGLEDRSRVKETNLAEYLRRTKGKAAEHLPGVKQPHFPGGKPKPKSNGTRLYHEKRSLDRYVKTQTQLRET